MANLIIDIGNTALKAAWSDGVTLGKTFRYQGEKKIDFISGLVRKVKPDIMVISSVSEISSKNADILSAGCGLLVILDPKHTEVLEKHSIPLYLTHDRAASVIAARYLFKGRGCTVFDMGTTLTADFISSDGVYSGGNISPGCRTRFKALNRYSRSLPLLDTPDGIEDIGHSVRSSVESGVITGIIFEIQGYIDRFPENIVVFTGGDANYFAKRMKNSIFVVCNLVLMGLALIADEYAEDNL